MSLKLQIMQAVVSVTTRRKNQG